MPKKPLSTDEQIEKLNEVLRIANEAAVSDDLVQKIGAVTLYAGLVDFYTIQTARLLEQVILKSQLAAGEKPRFAPRPDSYFYDNKIDTRRIVSIIKKDLLPFRTGSCGSVEATNQANILAQECIKKTSKSLDYRAAIIHHLGSSKMTLGELNTLCDKAIMAYHNFQRAHTAFFEVVQPYRFSMKEHQYFYGGHKY